MADDLRIRFLAVGQGDAIVGLIPGGRRAFVVDVFNADRVLDFLEAEGISEVVLFLTHSDRDHTLGAQDLLAELEAEHNPARVVAIFFSRDRIAAANGSAFATLVRFIGRVGRRMTRNEPHSLNADFNTVLNQIPAFAELFSPVRVHVVHPEKADQDSLIGNTNETAGVLLIEHSVGNATAARVLLTSDVQLTGISLMLDRIGLTPIRADVLKYPHHGAWPTSWPGARELGLRRNTMNDFLNEVMPSHVVFSVGSDNAHGHIRPEVLTMLADYHANRRKLLSVAWTELTESCREVRDLPIIVSTNAVDVEILIGDFLDGVSIRCHDLRVN